jgi:alpha-N-acetylglucosaminidase
MSFMLFKNQSMVIDRVRKWLKPDGEILFFQTMFKKKNNVLEFVKPKLKYVTTVDFGKVTYEDEFLNLLKSKRLTVKEDRLIEKKKWFKGEYRMVAATFENNGLKPHR